ncbi:FAD-binding oxidoreductase [Candidatus Symbiobacter mobilis]|uniref:DUF3782 domain-containing protein n=1 Tax=Candidatus Symbiobacter mobilis CR TaxID=946483 RepID=U5ND82_9BURK|nr:FAD-binding oxidoreductase [Candidatus Symbiobacter mobilis]AGX88134.1 hypothetical protein Cenrod_2063 [Candidatus Symbiobacter mobilis CR]
MTIERIENPTFDDVWRLIQEIALLGKETDRKLQETDRLVQENAKQIKETNRQLGLQGNRLGEFVQEMVRPALVRLFRDRNLPVHQVIPNMCSYDDNRQFRAEIDLLVVNTDVAIAVECKSHLKQADVDEHLERLGNFKEYFPQFKGFSILGAVAGMVLPDEVGRYAYRKGLYVLAQSGEGIDIRNDGQFQPQQW